jgi:hypothetical protein
MAALFPQRLHAEKEKNKFIGENLTQRREGFKDAKEERNKFIRENLTQRRKGLKGRKGREERAV